jgi:hypothetical protein
MNFEVLLDVKSVWAIYWIGGNRVMPKHIWYPIVTGAPRPKDGKAWDPTTFAPDPNLIASGPWRLDDYVSFSHVLLVANKPGSIVDTGITIDENANSVPITSPYGFFNYYPKYIDIHADNYQCRISPGYDLAKIWALVNFTATDHNKLQESYTFIYTDPDTANPIGKTIEFAMPDEPACLWQIVDYIDQHDPPGLSYCDIIQVVRVNPPPDPAWGPIWLHIQAIAPPPPGPGPFILTCGQVIEAEKTVLLDGVPLAEDAYGNTYTWPVHEFEKPCIPVVETFTLNLTGFHTATLEKHILTQWLLCKNNDLTLSPYYCHTISASWPVWVTVPEDICGAWYDTWHGSLHEVPAPDIRVDMTNDVFKVSRAMGSYPGHPRWNPVADINGDHQINWTDLSAVVEMFGWPEAIQGPITVDIAVTSVTRPRAKSVVCQGYNARINISIENQGNYWETFNVTVYANTTAVGTQTVTSLHPGETQTLTFTWNTSGFAKGNYTFSAQAWPSWVMVPDSDPADNNLSDGWVIVSMVGDVTGPDGWPDGVCDMLHDIRQVALGFGANLVTDPASPNYGWYVHPPPCPTNSCPHSPNYDINDDGTIDMLVDIRTVCINFNP